MRRSQKSKRVTWASDFNLCQVRLFLSEDSPSQVGLGTQDHLLAKASGPTNSGTTGSDDNLPPGFEGLQSNLWRNKLSQLPLVKWRCPLRFEVNIAWQVVAGNDSTEVEVENQREMRVLEAIYPRPSAIPPNPILEGAEGSFIGDESTPLVPVTPIEDEDIALDASVESVAPVTAPIISYPPLVSDGTFSSSNSANNGARTDGIPASRVEPDIVTAVQAVLSALTSNSHQGNLIDHELLMKILQDPKMIDQFLGNHGAMSTIQNVSPSSSQNMPSCSLPNIPATCTQNVVHPGTQVILPFRMHNMASSSIHRMPSAGTQHMVNTVKSLSSLLPVSVNRQDPPSSHITRSDHIGPSTTAANGPLNPPSSRIGPVPSLRQSLPEGISVPTPSTGAPIIKDINYYKSLIQQHGEERPEVSPNVGRQNSQHFATAQEPLHIAKSRETKSKVMKPCLYFNSSRGCRYGANCVYLHDASSQQRDSSIPEVQNAKRMKRDTEITGT